MPGLSNEFLLNYLSQMNDLSHLTNQDPAAQQGALVPNPPMALAKLNSLTQSNNAIINNLRRVTGNVDDSLDATQKLLEGAAVSEQEKPLASSAPDFLSPYIGNQANPFSEYSPLFYGMGSYGYPPNPAAPAGNPLIGLENGTGALGLATQAAGEGLLSNLNDQLPYNEDISEIITEPHPAHSSTPGASTALTALDPKALG